MVVGSGKFAPFVSLFRNQPSCCLPCLLVAVSHRCCTWLLVFVLCFVAPAFVQTCHSSSSSWGTRNSGSESNTPTQQQSPTCVPFRVTSYYPIQYPGNCLPLKHFLGMADGFIGVDGYGGIFFGRMPERMGLNIVQVTCEPIK